MDAMTEPISTRLIADLIAFDTVSAKPNMALIDHVRAYLAGLGVESRLVVDETGGKANLYATVGPTDRPGLMLSGHTDVVPVSDQVWTHEPFALTRVDGRLIGRGTADMKAFIAIVLAHVPMMLERGLKTPIHLAFSHDEEIGCVGVRRLITMIEGLDVRPAMCIVGEPTDMKIVIGHKGKVTRRVRVRGLECHSSLAPQGVNAVDYAAQLIVFIRDMADRLTASGRRDGAYDIEHTTIHTGVVHGGTVVNIVPPECWLDFEIRNLADDDPMPYLDEIMAHARDVLEPRMKAVHPDAGIIFEDLAGYPAMDTDPAEEVVSLVKSLTGENSHSKTAFGTEGGLFQQQAGIPTVVCGPGSIGQAHKPDEYITVEQVLACERFMARLIERLSA
jgi:acetylornithine deacetylase